MNTASVAESRDDLDTLSVIILAAGQGKRMQSTLPKVLHSIAGQPMLRHVLNSAYSLRPTTVCIVYGHGGEMVRAAFANEDIRWAKQSPQQGTGHAVLQALPHLPEQGIVLILYGDVPLISADTLRKLIQGAQQGRLAWLTANVNEPAGLGRILRDAQGQVQAIVEERDATEAQRAIREINTGFLACPTKLLAEWLPTLSNQNAQGEYYLTDILALAVQAGVRVETHQPLRESEIIGVNSKDQLANLERTHQYELAKQLMQAGVTLLDPARIDVRGPLQCGHDISIDVNCIFEGEVTLADNVQIGAHCILRNATIGAGSEILPYTFIDGAVIGEQVKLGPYARIRPGTLLENEVHIGNFVEVKASTIGKGSKANHLSYIGDATVGSLVNVGAGTITCNYDGANKHRTIIEDNVHIGSDVQLIAPVTIGQGATIAAGTTVWKDAPALALTLNEKSQLSRPGWKRPKKK